MALFPWGKIVAATANEVAELGPQAARVRALYKLIPGLSDEAGFIARDADQALLGREDLIPEFASIITGPRGRQTFKAQDKALDRVVNTIFDKELSGGKAFANDSVPRLFPAWGATTSAVTGEAISDLASPALYRELISPFAAARTFDLRRTAAPESFAGIARGLSERGLVTGPRDIRVAQRLSMEGPTFTQLVMSFVDDGMSLEDAMAAARALS
jgi:hypothetical protein